MDRSVAREVREEFLTLVCAGASLNAASRWVGRTSPWGVKVWRQAVPMRCVNGVKPRVGAAGGVGIGPVPACPGQGRKRRPITIHDRKVIANGMAEGLSYAQIGKLIGRDKSLICREVQRHRARDGRYHPHVAHLVAAVFRARPKQFKLHANPALCRRIEEWMKDGWSPQLIAAVLAAEGAAKMDRVSHETIYKALYVQSRGQLRKNLYQDLALRRKQRKTRGVPRQNSPYRDAFKISDRPAEVADRAVPGHWEADLILGAANGSAVGTLVERTTRFVVLLHLPNGHSADEVATAMIREMSKLPAHLRRSITYDRGTEMVRYADIQLALDLPIYFCNPASPWQRGSNENTNRLLRFWLPKGADLSEFSAADLDTIAAKLNARPRPTLGLRTPVDRLNELLLDEQDVA